MMMKVSLWPGPLASTASAGGPRTAIIIVVLPVCNVFAYVIMERTPGHKHNTADPNDAADGQPMRRRTQYADLW